MISEVRKIYIQDRIIRTCIAYLTKIRFGLTHYLVFLKKIEQNTSHFTKLFSSFIKIYGNCHSNNCNIPGKVFHV